MLFSLALTSVAMVSASVINNSLLGADTETTALLHKFEPNLAEIRGPGAIVFNVISVVLGLLGVIAVILMMYGGFLWLTAGGEENKAKTGTTLLFQAVIGLFIILSSYAVTYFVLVKITTAVTQ